MKTFYAFVLLAFLGLVILGCSESTDQLVAPVEKVSTLSLEKGIIHSATGSAHWKTVALTGQTNFKYSFSAIICNDGTVTGELVSTAKGLFLFEKANVYDLDIENNNMAKLAFHFTKGDLGQYYNPPVNIDAIYGWLVVIDNGEGNNAAGPDMGSLILFTDGSDIPGKTISEIDNMGPQELLDWIVATFGIPYELLISPIDQGSVQVR